VSGRRRLLMRSPPGSLVFLTDISRDGRALVTFADWRMGIVGLAPGETQERELSWFGYSRLEEMSRDGTHMLFFDETGAGSALYVRKTDGSSLPVRIAEEADGLALSPDAKWAVIRRPGRKSELQLVPTGAGLSKTLKLGGIDTDAMIGGTFFPDGKKILIEGVQPGRPYRSFVLDIVGGSPRPITPEGIHSQVISPDGQFVAALDAQRKILLYPVEGGSPKLAPGSPEPGELNTWSADGRTLYITEHAESKIRVFHRDLASGRRDHWRDIVPADPAGILFLSPIIVPDGKSYVYGYGRGLGTLFLVKGLK
jgi:eukaryotic-like serine/threonine-protein kinase